MLIFQILVIFTVCVNCGLIDVCYLAVSRTLLILDIGIMVIPERLSSKKAEEPS